MSRAARRRGRWELDPALGLLEVAEHLEGPHPVSPPEAVHAGHAVTEVSTHHDRPPRGLRQDQGEAGQGADAFRGDALAASPAEVEENRELRADRGVAR